MYNPPFLRRILPWLYVLVFVIAAPILLFYTAGYQYNLKKHMVEKSGTLIIDGAPKNAAIFIDGTDTTQTLPYTFQHVTPGWHTVRVQKAGFTSWSKRLEIHVKQVTFANDIQLWPINRPKLASLATVLRLEANPAATRLGVLDRYHNQIRLGSWDPSGDSYQLTAVSSNDALLSVALPIRWNTAGNAFILNGITNTAPTYWMTLDQTRMVDQLPTGWYAWSEPYLLTGSDDRSMVHLQIRSNRLTRETLSAPYVFNDQDISLQKTTSTPPALLLTKNSLQNRIYQLTNLNLRPVDRRQDILILTDPTVHEWLGLDFSKSPPYAGDVYGDYPRWLQDTVTPNRHRALLIQGNELWLWEPGQGTTLLWRQAEKLQQAAWDRDGTHVIVADAYHVFALELDDRDGRIVTPLADFQTIRDLAILQDTLYVSGTFEDKDGVFTLALK